MAQSGVGRSDFLKKAWPLSQQPPSFLFGRSYKLILIPGPYRGLVIVRIPGEHNFPRSVIAKCELCGADTFAASCLFAPLASEGINFYRGYGIVLFRTIERFPPEYGLKAWLPACVHSHRNTLDLIIGGNFDGDCPAALGFQLCVNGIHISNNLPQPRTLSILRKRRSQLAITPRLCLRPIPATHIGKLVNLVPLNRQPFPHPLTHRPQPPDVPIRQTRPLDHPLVEN